MRQLLPVFDEMSTPNDLTPPPLTSQPSALTPQPAPPQPQPGPQQQMRTVHHRRRRPFSVGLALLWGAALAALVAAIVLFLTRI